MIKPSLPVMVLLGMIAGPACAEKLTVARLEASPGLDGPLSTGVRISPDGKRVTFLQGRPENKLQQDLWEYHIADKARRKLVDSVVLLGGEEQLDEVELARRERQRISATGIVEYSFSLDGKAL